MGNDLYDENKRLKRENEGLRESLRAKVDNERIPNLIEGCLFAFLQGHAEFHVSGCGQPTYGIRFLVDAPPAPTGRDTPMPYPDDAE